MIGMFRYLKPALALVLLPVAYFAVSLRSTLNIGYRHILPVLPFLFIVISLQILIYQYLLNNIINQK